MEHQPKSDVTEQGIPLKCLLDFFSKKPKRNPRQWQGAWILLKPRSLGVRNAAILQNRLVASASNVLLVVLLAAIGQGHLWFLRNPGPRSLAW